MAKKTLGVENSEVCRSCRFWRSYIRNGHTATNGQCRRLPPQLRSDGYSRWPETYEHDWCGEWVLIEKGKP